MAFVRARVVSGNCCSGACSGSCSGTGGRTGCGFLVAVGVHVGIEFIGLLELLFVLEALLLSKAIAFGGIGIQLLRLGGLALGFCGLNLGVGVGLLRFGLATLCVRFPSMNFMFGLGAFLADPCCFLALVFALLSCGLTTDRDNDADDNQNYDDCCDYPDDGGGIHAFSPCCPFGCH